MTRRSNVQDSVEAQAHQAAFAHLLTHACWPVPPAAWGHLFVATAALSETYDPAPAHPDGRMRAATMRLMIDLLDQAHRDIRDHRPLRAFIPLVRGRSGPVETALRLAERRLLSEGWDPERAGAAALLEQLRTDATERMVRGLTKGIGADQADEDRPDLASDLRNPYELADQLDQISGLLLGRLVDLIRVGDPDTRLMDRLAVLIPLAEASAELRGSQGVVPAEIRIRKTDETVMRLLEALGPDLVPAPAARGPRPDPSVRRRGFPTRKAAVVSDTHNPYLMIQQVGHRSRILGEALTRIRDHVRSVERGDIVPMGRRRIPEPDNLDALVRTLRRVHAGA